MDKTENPILKQAHLPTAQCRPTDLSLQKSLLCQPWKKNKKSPRLRKNKTLPMHILTYKTCLVKESKQEKNEGQLVIE